MKSSFGLITSDIQHVEKRNKRLQNRTFFTYKYHHENIFFTQQKYTKNALKTYVNIRNFSTNNTKIFLRNRENIYATKLYFNCLHTTYMYYDRVMTWGQSQSKSCTENGSDNQMIHKSLTNK